MQILPYLIESLDESPMDHCPGGDAFGADIQIEKPVAQSGRAPEYKDSKRGTTIR